MIADLRMPLIPHMPLLFGHTIRFSLQTPSLHKLWKAEGMQPGRRLTEPGVTTKATTCIYDNHLHLRPSYFSRQVVINDAKQQSGSLWKKMPVCAAVRCGVGCGGKGRQQ